MEFDSETFKKHIKIKRVIDNNMSMDKACFDIGISKATLSRLEKGKLPDIQTFAKVCSWLNVSPYIYFIKQLN